MTAQKDNSNQYYWFSPEEIKLITVRLELADEGSLAESISAELKVADIRADASRIPVDRLGNALGLEAGSKPLWLSEEEYNLLQKLIK